MKKKILFSCPFPLTFRNFINTGLASEIEKKLDMKSCIVSPYNDSFFSFEAAPRFKNYSVESCFIDNGIPQLSDVNLIDRIFKSIHLTGFAIEFPDASLQNIELSSRRNLTWYIAKYLTIFFPRNTKLRFFFRFIYGKFRPGKNSIKRIFDEVQPYYVIVASPGHYWLDHFIIDEAKKRNVPVFCIILSWDNLYSRGPLCRRPDVMMVWSDEMKKQAIEIHDFPEKNIEVVGALQFKFYDAIPTSIEINNVKNKLGIDLNQEYIAYVCGARTASYDVEDILEMKRVIDASKYKNCKIVVRPHPQGKKDVYLSLLKHNILVDTELDIVNSRVDVFDKDSIKYMAAFLTGARFVISSWGTTALLEACIFQRPSVQLRWMNSITHLDKTEVEMVSNFQRYLHMKAFDNEGARLYCDSPNTLIDKLNILENEKASFMQKRSNVVNKIVLSPFDKVVDRVVEKISSLKHRPFVKSK